MMIKYTTLIITFLFSQNMLALGIDDKEALCRKALKQVLVASGRYKPGIEATLQIKLWTNLGRVASYRPDERTIYVEGDAFDICFSLGEEKGFAALAFIIAHELQHHFQEVTCTTNFAAYYGHDGGIKNNEINADFYGAVYTFLAGYDIQDVIPIFIDSLYNSEAYDFSKNKSDTNYLSYEERRRLALDVDKKLKDWVQVFTAAKYFAIIKEYDKAISCHKFLIRKLDNPETRNNYGITLLQKAMNFTDPGGEEINPDNFAYPFEMEWAARFTKPLPEKGKRKGDGKFYALLNQALTHFDEALSIEPSYTPAKINKACVLVLSKKYEEALCYLEEIKNLKQDEIYAAKIKLLTAILKAKAEAKIEAGKILESLQSINHLGLQNIVSINLQRLKDPTKVTEKKECGIPESLKLHLGKMNFVDLIPLRTIPHLPRFKYLNASRNTFGKIIVHFKNNIFTFDRLNTNKLAIEDMPDLQDCGTQLLSQGETAIFSKPDQVILILNSNGKVREYVRYNHGG